MIKKITREFVKDEHAYKETSIYLLNWCIYYKEESTISKDVINKLSNVKSTKIKGFNYEN